MKRLPVLLLALWTLLGLAPVMGVLAVHALHPVGAIGTWLGIWCAVTFLGLLWLIVRRPAGLRTRWTLAVAALILLLGGSSAATAMTLGKAAPEGDFVWRETVEVGECRPVRDWVWTCEVTSMFDTFEVTGAVTPWDTGRERVIAYDRRTGIGQAGDYAQEPVRQGLGFVGVSAVVFAVILGALSLGERRRPKPAPAAVTRPPSRPASKPVVPDEVVALGRFPFGPAATAAHRRLDGRRRLGLTLWAVFGLGPVAVPVAIGAETGFIVVGAVWALITLLFATLPVRFRRQVLDQDAWVTADELLVREGSTTRAIPLRRGVVDIASGELTLIGTRHKLPLAMDGHVRASADLDVLRARLAASPHADDRRAAELLPRGEAVDPVPSGEAPPPMRKVSLRTLPPATRERPRDVPAGALPLSTVYGDGLPESVGHLLGGALGTGLLFLVMGAICAFIPGLGTLAATQLGIAAIQGGGRIVREIRARRDFRDAWLSGHHLHLRGPSGVLIADLHGEGVTADGDLVVKVPVGRRKFPMIIAACGARRPDAEVRAIAAALAGSPHEPGRTAARRVLALVPADATPDSLFN